MLEFMRKITEWILQKEEEAAKSCKIPIEEIEKQIEVVKEKKRKLQEECEKNINELDKIIKRLESIKNIELTRCAKK
jgi:exonuclease VII small subunit